jgi:TRAP-type C4-dicarboxylate transport system permease small subunit
MRRLYERLIAAEASLAATFLVLMVALIFLGAAMRVLGHPVNWSTDAATAFFAWACFLCADIAWRRNSLLSVNFLVQRLPAGLQKACRVFNHLVISAFLLYVIGVGTWLSWVSRERSFQGIPEVSYSWVTLSMVVGGALLLVTTLLKLRAELRGAEGRCSSSSPRS